MDYRSKNISLINNIKSIAEKRGWGYDGQMTFINDCYGINFPRLGFKVYRDEYDRLTLLSIDELRQHTKIGNLIHNLGNTSDKNEIILITLDNYIMDVLHHTLPKELLDYRFKIKFASVMDCHYNLNEWKNTEKSILSYTL